jgi:hypothetical protein
MIEYIDAANRCSDLVALHLSADLEGARNSWVAIRLSDGGSDGVLYETRDSAICHQLHETQCAYLKIPPGGITVREAMSYLHFHRQTYDAGFRLVKP